MPAQPLASTIPGAVDLPSLTVTCDTQVKRDGVSKLVILPLYPQFSISTSGSSLRLLEAVFKSDPALRGLPHTVIPSWYQRRGYIVAQADLIEVLIVPVASHVDCYIWLSCTDSYGVMNTQVLAG